MRDACYLALLWGTAYAGVYLLAASGGHSPSMTKGLPVSAADYYWWAAAYSVPVCLGLTWLVAIGAEWVAGPHRLGVRASMKLFAPTYCGPFLWCFVVPDLLTLAFFGFEHLTMVMRISGPLTVLLICVHTYQKARRHYSVTGGRALAMTVAAAMFQGIPAALLLR